MPVVDSCFGDLLCPRQHAVVFTNRKGDVTPLPQRAHFIGLRYLVDDQQMGV